MQFEFIYNIFLTRVMFNVAYSNLISWHCINKKLFWFVALSAHIYKKHGLVSRRPFKRADLCSAAHVNTSFWVQAQVKSGAKNGFARRRGESLSAFTRVHYLSKKYEIFEVYLSVSNVILKPTSNLLQFSWNYGSFFEPSAFFGRKSTFTFIIWCLFGGNTSVLFGWRGILIFLNVGAVFTSFEVHMELFEYITSGRSPDVTST